MRKIVVSAIMAMVLTVGAHQLALVMGGTDPIAAAAVAAFALAVAVVATVAFAVAADLTAVATFVAFAVAAIIAAAVADLAAAPVTSATVVTTIALAAVSVIVIATVVVIAGKGIRLRWTAPAHFIEGLAVACALIIGSIGWSAVIVLVGSVALFLLLRLESKQVRTQTITA